MCVCEGGSWSRKAVSAWPWRVGVGSSRSVVRTPAGTPVRRSAHLDAFRFRLPRPAGTFQPRLARNRLAEELLVAGGRSAPCPDLGAVCRDRGSRRRAPTGDGGRVPGRAAGHAGAGGPGGRRGVAGAPCGPRDRLGPAARGPARRAGGVRSVGRDDGRRLSRRRSATSRATGSTTGNDFVVVVVAAGSDVTGAAAAGSAGSGVVVCRRTRDGRADDAVSAEAPVLLGRRLLTMTHAPV